MRTKIRVVHVSFTVRPYRSGPCGPSTFWPEWGGKEGKFGMGSSDPRLLPSESDRDWTSLGPPVHTTESRIPFSSRLFPKHDLFYPPSFQSWWVLHLRSKIFVIIFTWFVLELFKVWTRPVSTTFRWDQSRSPLKTWVTQEFRFRPHFHRD